ncbi:hypothetical protein [Methylobacterium sp. WL9]|uniref:hypothetical protein n=1 Tax=Methylobacterium sp. WL9 TaxID=2603898 RepID=UPI0011C93641|nr:hypothetical protein [Methylobacterium sp. WL9]TXN19562.1 hypothetical protein FV217_20910 [Methylobacterium sp. WL9]
MSASSLTSNISSVAFLKAVHGETFSGFHALFAMPSKKTTFYDSSQWSAMDTDIARLGSVLDIYSVIGTQRERLQAGVRGSVATVRQMSGLVIDVDFASMKDTNKRYVAHTSAAADVRRQLSIAPSAVVSTGNGEHWHWFLKRPVLIENEEELQNAKEIAAAFSRYMQTIFRQSSAEIDSIGDITRAFRIPGTFNHKGGEKKPVVLLEFDPEKRYSTADIERLIKPASPSKAPARRRRPSDGFGLADHETIGRGCSWYGAMSGEGAEDASEPEWFAAASITACCQDGERIFHAYSSAYAGYDERETQQKFDRARLSDAPRTCSSIESDLGHEACRKCPYYGFIKSPVQIGSGPPRYDPGSEGPIPLGYNRDGLYSLRDQSRNIIVSASAQQLLSSQWLQGVAPSAFWRRQYPSKSLFNFAAAGEGLIAACKRSGPFNPLRIRGRGIWIEDNEVVLNLGNPIREGLKNQYLCFEPISLPDNAAFDATRLLDLLSRFKFREPKNAMLLLGWLAIAPICGVLSWRPHCFIYGPPKAGKSTLHRLASAILTPLAISTTGDSSEAGIRQAVGPDSLPVIIDEFESDQRRGRQQAIIMLARSASSGDTPILRGTPEGKAMQFSLRTTFFFSGINPAGLSPADASRILLLELLMHDNDQEDARQIAAELAYFADTGPRWCAYMASRALLISPAREVFEMEMAGMDSRLRTNIATLLGAGFVALRGRIPAEGEAKEQVADFESTTAGHAEEVDRDDALEALHHLLAYPIGQASLGQWIARELRDRVQDGDKDTRPSAQILSGLDIAMNAGNKDPGFFLLKGAPGIEKIFKDTQWAGGAWMHAIRKYIGAFSPRDPVYFSNIRKKARAIGIGFDILPEATESQAEESYQTPKDSPINF